MWDVKEPTHCSQRVGDVVPGVVVWSCIVITAGPHQQLLPLPTTTTTTTSFITKIKVKLNLQHRNILIQKEVIFTQNN